MLSRLELEAYRNNLVAEHKRVVAALDTLIAHMSIQERSGAGEAAAPPHPMQPDAMISAPSLGLGPLLPAGAKSTLESHISPILKASPEMTWTSRMIYERLKPLDVSLPNPADAAINAVSTVLNRMADKGSLTIVEKGKGRRPSTYRLAANDGLSEKEVNSEEKTS